MIVFPNAKINIGLNILKKRKDNFHNLESLFYPVDWKDALEIIPSESFRFSLSGINVAGNQEDNLCVKVYQYLEKEFQLPPVAIHLHKNIPIGAGLGGGSSDAAFTLKLLNQLFKLNLSVEKMQEIIRPFGSDCAFFIENTPMLAFEKGDRFEKAAVSLSGKPVCIVYPDLHISTKEAYEGVVPDVPSLRIKELLKEDLRIWKEKLVNDFEKGIAARHPVIAKLKEDMYKMGAIYASMSGSGSSVYGIFEKEMSMKNIFPENFRVWKGILGA